MSDAFFEAYKSLPKQKTIKREYRLYYDPESGNPLFYSSEDDAGAYLVVDKETYNIGNYNCRVVNGKIINLNVTKIYCKFVPSDSGITTHSDNIMLIAMQGKNWKLKTYED